jgi:tRNA G18 (ribose-2'-O)-methylase SpoU
MMQLWQIWIKTAYPLLQHLSMLTATLIDKATGIRNTNGFLGREVWIVGDKAKRYDKRGTVGTHHYEHVKYAQNWGNVLEAIPDISEYCIVAVDNMPNATAIHEFQWPEKTLMMFGEEQRGLSEEALSLADHVVYIPMRGSVRSFNVGTASGIAMYDYIVKLGAAV